MNQKKKNTKRAKKYSQTKNKRPKPKNQKNNDKRKQDTKRTNNITNKERHKPKILKTTRKNIKRTQN